MSQARLTSWLLIAVASTSGFAGCAKSGTNVTDNTPALIEPFADDQSANHLPDAEELVEETPEPEPEPELLSLRDQFIGSVHENDWVRAREIATELQFVESDAELMSSYVALLLHDDHFSAARDLARRLAAENPDQREHWQGLYYDAFEADPTYWSPTPRALIPGEDFERLESLGGGSTVTIKMKVGEETIAVFKPHSTLGQSYYRGEVAAYRLCELIDCGFSVPRNEEVRIRVDDFVAAYGLRSLTSASPGTYARRFRDLITFTDADGVAWIHGTKKDWVPGFTTFAIEHTEGWLWLVNGSRSREQLENMSLEDALRPMRGRERSYVPAILERRAETTAIDFARQLSNLHVFDMLLNNWDRYSGQFWGVNCQWNHGQFVSIDNGATLQASSWGSNLTTRNRQRRVRVYSRSTVEAIRNMDLERVRNILLPASAWHTDEDDRFSRFVQARADFLAWIDAEIARRGEKAVLLFD